MKFLQLLVLPVLYLLCNFNINAQTKFPADIIEQIALSKQKTYKHTLNYKQLNSVGDNYDIKYHCLNINVDPNVRFISGSISTYFLVNQNGVSQITFDFSDTLFVDSVIYNNNTVFYNTNNDILTIDLPVSLNLNDFDSVCVYYHGIPRYDGNRAFGQAMHDTINPVPIIWTLSQPYSAKEWWPCKQDLNDKIDSIDVIVTTPSEYRVASNGLLISETLNAGYTSYHWKHKYPITAYLIAFAVTNYAVYSDYVPFSANDSLEVLNYVYPEDSATLSTKKDIIDIIQLYNNLFIEYPFKEERYGHAQFSWMGGMEHQTMSFMYNFGFHLVAHEVAHQWFGDYITCGSWQDIWLNEGFATYCNGLSYEHLLNGYYWPYWKIDLLDKITDEPDGSVFCEDTTSVERIFSSRLSYSKGAYVLHMLRWELGDSLFFESVKNYLNDTLLSNNFARTNDLIYHFETVGDTNLTEFFNDWFYSEGFPYYSILWSQNSDSIVNLTIEQTQSHTSVSFFEMHVPLQFWGNSVDTIIKFMHNSSGENFSFKAPFMVDSIVFDPEMWIITKNPLIEHIKTIEKDDEKLIIYPNPVKDELIIHAPKNLNINKINIIDINGKLIKEVSITDFTQNIVIDLSNMKAGSYCVEIITGYGKISKKVVKQ